jgi:hypothetical protein
VNGLLLAGVTRKGQDAELAAYGRFAAVSTAANTFSQQVLEEHISVSGNQLHVSRIECTFARRSAAEKR